LLCGHYKDVDQRVADHLATEELSIGDFVLSGGEPAVLVVVDATFHDGGISAPSYTRPPSYRGFGVPEVLLSGDHKRIAQWREEEGRRRTAMRRKVPDTPVRGAPET
jgi:tRNA (guanine37-N1)-methyltransferase